MEPRWTITELARAAAAALEDEPVRVNGRVRDRPNARLIRWYTTIGLVDPPSGRRGRTALYGERHLLQLVAVKRRQAAGRTIAEIQAELLGAPDDRLREIARIPAGHDLHPAQDEDGPGASAGDERRPDVPDVSFRAVDHAPAPGGVLDTAQAPPHEPAGPRTHRRFWAQAASTARAGTGGAPHGTPGSPAVRPVAVPGVRLAPGVTLLLDTTELTPADLAAIGRAAEPLLAELHRRGLLPDPDRLDDPASPIDPHGRHP